MSGFTAEVSLYNINQRYQAITDALHYDRIVQPAISIADLVGQQESVFSGPSLVDWARCLRHSCELFVPDPRYPTKAVWICITTWAC